MTSTRLVMALKRVPMMRVTDPSAKATPAELAGVGSECVQRLRTGAS